MLANNVSVGFALSGGSHGRFVMAARLVQHQVKDRKFTVRKKWLDVIHCVQASGGKCNLTLQVNLEAVSATTSKTSTPNQLLSVFKVAACSAPTPNYSFRKGQALLSEEISPGKTKVHLTNHYGQHESYQEAKKFLTEQQFNGGELFIKVPGFFRELPLDAVTLARLLLIFLGIHLGIHLGIQILKENSLKEAIPEIVLIMVALLVLLQQMEGNNHLRNGVLTDANKQFLLLCSIGLVSLTGSDAVDSIKNKTFQSGAVDEIIEEVGYFKAAALILASITIGGAAVWWILKQPATSEFEVDQGLMRSPTPTKSNPNFKIHPTLTAGVNP